MMHTGVEIVQPVLIGVYRICRMFYPGNSIGGGGVTYLVADSLGIVARIPHLVEPVFFDHGVGTDRRFVELFG